MEEQYENQMTEAEMLKQRNATQNANNVRNLANVAANTNNVYAKAAGKAVQTLDKLTDGKSSEKLGKALNNANKLVPGGMLAQKTLNKMNESGTSSRIGNALSKKNSSMPIPSKSNMKSNAVAEGKENSLLDRREVEDQTSDGGEVNLKATANVIKIGLIAFAPLMIVLIFMNLIVAGSQTYLQVIGLDHADQVSSEGADKAIREEGSEGLLDDEITDENVGEGAVDVTFNFYDVFIEDTNVYSNKLNKQNFIGSTRYREYSEADLRELEDFYSDIGSYENGNYNMDTVYKFFFKLYYIQRYYSNDNRYNVDLDMPLIMSILTVQSSDKSEVFESNIKKYKVSRKENNDDFKYDNNWSNEILSESNARDIEILAQNMVTRVEGSSCPGTIDGACYKLVDDEQYKEFLKGFLEKKYFLKGYKLGEVSQNYTFIESNNQAAVSNLITQIYDTKEQYEDLAGGYTVVENIVPVSNNKFWWPIGSMETEEINGVLYAKGEPASIHITSSFGNQESFRASKHGGIDISNAGNGPGVLNVIAVKAGEVIYPTKTSQTQYPDNGSLDNNDGGGYGNYVKIKHSDGTYTIYAHLAQNSITVMAGDVVDQGQVIGKMGHSGQSTATHLHFEVRLGSDSHAGRVYPLDYVDPNNPRPMSYGSGNNFSLTTTTLSREEFVARMMDYYERTKKEGFYKNFALNAGEVYDVSLANNVNPELVVVTAGTEQNWTLSAACQYTNNYWGIGITNGNGCNSGGKYDSLAEGIAAYANVLSTYSEYGKYAESITNIYNDRSSAGCDSSGHGLPGTLEGMQSIYSWLGDYRYNPGSWGLGGCKYLNIIYGENYCSIVATCVGSSNCSEESKTTVCEQNDYTAYQLKQKIQMRYDIFGL